MRFLVPFLLAAASLSAQTPQDTPPQPETPSQLPKVEVTTNKQQLQLDTIDRRVYNVGQDIQAMSGTAADVLRNIPSVDVDVDGNVSIRGDPSVQILIDGRPSGLMSTATRADILSQFPADSIDRIEVITTPSAKYKPDGTGGIINIILKKKHGKPSSGSLKVMIGNDGRYGLSASGNYSKGPFSISGMAAYRHDNRLRTATETRIYKDPTTGLTDTEHTVTTENADPVFKIAELETEYQLNKDDKVTETLNYTHRTFHRHSDESTGSVIGGVPGLYDRLRDDPENEQDVETDTAFEHAFGRDDHTLTAELRWAHHTETEDNHYTDVYTQPVTPNTYDTNQFYDNEPSTEGSLTYSNTFNASNKLEAGFDWTDDITRDRMNDANFDPVSGQFLNDPTITNSFDLNQAITAVYATYSRTMGPFGAMLGLREEYSDVQTHEITLGTSTTQAYTRLYPTLHLSYDFTDTSQWMLNFSERVHRPDDEDLDPFPKYQDPYTLWAGNPNLRPEEVYLVETGYQYKNDDTTYLADVFYKYSTDGFTQVSQVVDSTTLLTTEENLANTRSGGLELSANTKPTKKLTLNASASLYENQIDASNLGYSSSLSTFAWTAKANAEYAFTPASALQINMNYNAKRLTPQGYRMPSFVSNLGYKHDFAGHKWSFVLTVSDLFNTLKDETKLTTPTLVDDYMRRRNARAIWAGLIYSFGSQKKKKDDSMQFDNSM